MLYRFLCFYITKKKKIHFIRNTQKYAIFNTFFNIKNYFKNVTDFILLLCIENLVLRKNRVSPLHIFVKI